MLKWIKKKISILANDTGGMAPIEIAVVFSIVAIAATVILGPMITSTGDQLAYGNPDGIDRTFTGSIRKAGSANARFSPTERYIVRRSVLQLSRQSRCIIYADGVSEGDC